MTPYELWDGDVVLVTDIRDKRNADRMKKRATDLLGLSDVRVVYRTPERYRRGPTNEP